MILVVEGFNLLGGNFLVSPSLCPIKQHTEHCSTICMYHPLGLQQQITTVEHWSAKGTEGYCVFHIFQELSMCINCSAKVSEGRHCLDGLSPDVDGLQILLNMWHPDYEELDLGQVCDQA